MEILKSIIIIFVHSRVGQTRKKIAERRRVYLRVEREPSYQFWIKRENWESWKNLCGTGNCRVFPRRARLYVYTFLIKKKQTRKLVSLFNKNTKKKNYPISRLIVKKSIITHKACINREFRENSKNYYSLKLASIALQNKTIFQKSEN